MNSKNLNLAEKGSGKKKKFLKKPITIKILKYALREI